MVNSFYNIMEIAFKDIKVGEVYGIKSILNSTNKYIGECMSISQNKSSVIFKFKMNYVWNGPQSMWNESIFYDIGFNYYILGQKEKIQQKMEERALNTILEKIIGHPYQHNLFFSLNGK
jgi:hypothetical protein